MPCLCILCHDSISIHGTCIVLPEYFQTLGPEGLILWRFLLNIICGKCGIYIPAMMYIMWVQCSAVIARSIFCCKYSQKTPHSLPLRARYGMSFFGPASDWYSAWGLAIFHCTGPHYNGTQLHFGANWPYIIMCLYCIPYSDLLVLFIGQPCVVIMERPCCRHIY